MVQRSIPIHVFRTNPLKRASRSRRKIKTISRKAGRIFICLSMVCIKVQLIVSMHVVVPLARPREVSVSFNSELGTLVIGVHD